MTEYEILALRYVFMKNRIALKEGSIKGLRYKQCFDYDKMIKKIAYEIEKNNINDLEGVLNYGD